MKFYSFLSGLIFLFFTLHSQAAECPLYTNPSLYTVAKGTFIGDRVCQSPTMLQALEVIAKQNGTPIKITWGFRSPHTQDKICLDICGKTKCPGRCSENSGHTDGIAVDIETRFSALEACNLLDSIRNYKMGGVGGIGNYGSTISHIELSDKKCNLSYCGKTIGKYCDSGYESALVKKYIEEKTAAGTK